MLVPRLLYHVEQPLSLWVYTYLPKAPPTPQDT